MIVNRGGLRDTPLSQIPAKLELYSSLIAAAEPLFNITGQKLEDVVKEHVQNLALYDTMLQECKTIEYYLQARRDEVEATLHRKYLETSQRQLGARDLVMYIRGDEQMVEVNNIVLEVSHVCRQLEAIVESFKTMGWSLSNIVKLRVAQLDHTII